MIIFGACLMIAYFIAKFIDLSILLFSLIYKTLKGCGAYR
ncbi:hypothetical protein [Priestia megaterium]